MTIAFRLYLAADYSGAPDPDAAARAACVADRSAIDSAFMAGGEMQHICAILPDSPGDTPSPAPDNDFFINVDGARGYAIVLTDTKGQDSIAYAQSQGWSTSDALPSDPPDDLNGRQWGWPIGGGP